VRKAGDELAWAAIRLGAEAGEVRVVLLHDALTEQAPPGVETVSSPPVEYDEIVGMIAWADKVVVW
jgi:hypothetical protein